MESCSYYCVADMMNYPKAGMHTPILGQMYWFGTKEHADGSENVELQRKEMVSGFLDCDHAESEGTPTAPGAGIYIRATVHSMKTIRSGSTSSRVVMGVVHCAIVDSDSDTEIEVNPRNC